MFTSISEYLKSGVVVFAAGAVAFWALSSAGMFTVLNTDKLPAHVVKLDSGASILEKKIDTAASIPDYSRSAVQEAKSTLKSTQGKSYRHIRNNTVKLTNKETGQVIEAALDTVKSEDGTTRVILSQPGAQKETWNINGIDTVIVPESTQSVKHNNAAGLYGTVDGKEYGIWYDRDFSRARVGVEVGVQNAKPRIALKLGMTF